jgi:hypothetical protein
MKSKFRFTAYIVGLLAISSAVFGVMALSGNLFNPTMSLGPSIYFCSLVVFVWIWLFFGELRTKIISIDIKDNYFVIRRYLGMGKVKIFYLEEISGFKTSILPSRSGSYEYLYLMSGDRKVAKLSAFYHSNYKGLKSYLVSLNIKFIGVEYYSNRQELKEIFSK